MKSIFFILAWCLPTFLFAQNFNRPLLDSLFQEMEKKNQVMGNIAIYQDGKKVYTQSMGYKDIETRSKANSHTQYRVGSTSKTYTATLIMKLVEENKLALSDKLADFYPDLPEADKITIEQLLGHSSGLANLTDRPDYSLWNQEPKTEEELLEMIKEGGTDYEPGSRNEYSNTNYILLSFIAEKVTGKPYANLLEKEILKPLNLKETHFGGRIRPKNNEALSYTIGNKNWQLAPQTDMSIPLGAGGVAASASNVAQFYDALFAHQLINESSLDKMINNGREYGLGLFAVPFKDKTAYGHPGQIDGFSSVTAYFPKEKTAAVLLTNGSQTDLRELLEGALSIYFGYDYAFPDFEPITNPEKYTGTYSSDDFPLELEIFAKTYALFGQATGQSAFKLKRDDENEFSFAAADLKIHFFPEEHRLTLAQYGNTFELAKTVHEKVENIEQYTGVYAADGFPMDMKIFSKDGVLFGQATGQTEFHLSPVKNHLFEFKPANLTISFDPEAENLELTQNGQSFTLDKKEE